MTPTTRSITLHPGETIILPQGVTIVSVVTDGSISVTSSCNNLPPPTAYACATFTYVIDVDDNDSHPMDEQNTYYNTLKVGDTTFDLSGILVIGSGENPGTLTPSSTVNAAITDPALVEILDIAQTDLFDKRQYITMTVKVPETFIDTMELSVYDRGITAYYKATETDCPEE